MFLRLADAYLIIAEAACETDDLAKARLYLNTLRARSNASEITTNDQDELRQIIRDERFRELHGEYKAVFDIRRWGPEVVRDHFENHPARLRFNATFTWSDRNLLWPIPQEELTYNALMEQNEGW
jgi:hypothetical protein